MEKFEEKFADLPSRHSAFCERLGYTFSNPTLLIEALTHSSLTKEWVNQGESPRCNERFEFLGDAVLGLALSTWLVAHPETYDEGRLSKIRASLINEKALARTARALRLDEQLLLGRGEEKGGGRSKDSLLADALEAVFGAIYLDGGFAAAEGIILKLFQEDLSGPLEERIQHDYKTTLQELTQNIYKQTPTYRVTTKSGPDHEAWFEVEVLFGSRVLARGQGVSKKKASQEAARLALEYFTKNPQELNNLHGIERSL